MRIIVFLYSLAFLTFASPTKAELLVDVSEPNLEISTGFSGDTLTLFGTAEPKGDIVILVKGPEKETVIRRKVDVMGLWVQADSVTFKNVPGYYNVASSRPVQNIAAASDLEALRLGIDSLVFENAKNTKGEKHDRFQEALIQNMQLKHLYSLTPDAVTYLNDKLFKTRITMPAHVPIGNYTIEAFLFKDGALIDREVRPFSIHQVGLSADVHDFAFTRPFFYGLTVVMAALFAGIMAAFLLRRD